jgi:hypothetical protein
MKTYLLIAIAALMGSYTGQAQKKEGKFLPVYYIKYSNKPDVAESYTEYSSQFDLIIAGEAKEFSNLWAKKGLNSWQALRSYNPKIILALYQMGPLEYEDNAPYWYWIKSNHGAAAGPERWTGSGHEFNYLSNPFYHSERLMYLGNSDWQKFWTGKTYEDRYITSLSSYKGADAIFSDNTGFSVPYPNSWYDENNLGKEEFKDYPSDYATADGIYDDTKLRKDMKAFFNQAVPFLASKPKPIKLIVNFGNMGEHPEYWIELDSMKNRPFAAMEEGAFVIPWFDTFENINWETKINVMKNLKNIIALMNNTGKVNTGEGLGKMDGVITDGNMKFETGWDALWFSMTSFLMALNENKSNGYFGFTVWGYRGNYYFDEYDPKYLHLGKPLGDYYISTTGASKDIAFREYEDGWVVINKWNTDAKTNVPVPSGKAYVVTHRNLKNPYGTLVTSFDIGKNRGLILLKKGRKIGNEDNLKP